MRKEKRHGRQHNDRRRRERGAGLGLRGLLRGGGVECGLVTLALIVVVVAAWLLWERPWRQGAAWTGGAGAADAYAAGESIDLGEIADRAVGFYDGTEPVPRILAGAEAQTSPDGVSAVTSGAAGEETTAAEADEAAEEALEDVGTLTMVSEEEQEKLAPLPQPVIPYVADATLHAHRSAVAGQIVFCGDSRYVGMHLAVGGDDIYIAKVGAGYEWFTSSALAEVDSTCTAGTILVIGLGVNDLGNVSRYISKVNSCMERWSAAGVVVCYMSVNPVVDGRSNVTNARIESFNSVIRSSLDPRILWINTYSSLMANGYATVDGVHYKNATYRQIYDLCLSTLSAYAGAQASEETAVDGGEGELGEGAGVSENDASLSENALGEGDGATQGEGALIEGEGIGQGDGTLIEGVDAGQGDGALTGGVDTTQGTDVVQNEGVLMD